MHHPPDSNARDQKGFALVCTLLGIVLSCGGRATDPHMSGAIGGRGGTAGATATAGQAAIGAGGSAGSTPQCTTDADCPRSGPCIACPDGSTLCPSSRCGSGQCLGSPVTCAIAAGSGGGGSAGMGGASGMGGAPECTSARDCHIAGFCLTCSDGTTTCTMSDCADRRCVVLFNPCPSGDGGAAGAFENGRQ